MSVSEIQSGLLKSADLLDVEQAKAEAAGTLLEQVQAPYAEARQVREDFIDRYTQIRTGLTDMQRQLEALSKLFDYGLAASQKVVDIVDEVKQVRPTSKTVDAAANPARAAIVEHTEPDTLPPKVREFLELLPGLGVVHDASRSEEVLGRCGEQHALAFRKAREQIAEGFSALGLLGKALSPISETVLRVDDVNTERYNLTTISSEAADANATLKGNVGTAADGMRDLAQRYGA